MAGPNRLRPVEVLRARCEITKSLPKSASARDMRTHPLRDVMVGAGPDHPWLALLNSRNPWMVGLSPPRRHDGLGDAAARVCGRLLEPSQARCVQTAPRGTASSDRSPARREEDDAANPGLAGLRTR